jgi:YcxB-like protein
MRIEYNLEPEDWADFGEYWARHSAVYRRVIRNNAIAGVLGLVLCVAAVGLWSKSPVSPIVAVCAIGGVVGWVLNGPRRIIANVRKTMAGRERPCLRGLHSLDALPDGLHSQCDISDSTVRWVGIRNVIQTNDHLFLMLSESQGYIIPKGRIIQGDLDRFLEDVTRYRS